MSGPPGRRAARRPRRSGPPRSGPLRLAGFLVLVLPVLAVPLVALVATGPPEQAATTLRPASRPLTRQVLVCPESAGGDRVVSVPLPGSPASQGADGGTVSSGGLPVLSRRGPVADLPSGKPARAGGTLSAGLLAAAGRAAVPCSAPRSSWWFTGVGGAPGQHTSELRLSNVDSSTAVVDVTVLGADGPVDTSGTHGIPIASGHTRTVKLADVAPSPDDEVVHVASTQGRVVASVDDRRFRVIGGSSGAGPLPDQVSPSRTVTLPPLPPDAAAAVVVVANPGDLDALVDVTVVGESGSFRPQGQQQLRVPPGSVSTVDLGRLGSGHQVAGIRLTSSEPVTATLRGTVGTATVRAASSAPVAQARAALLPAHPGGRTSLLLAAGTDGQAVAEVTGFDDRGRQVGHTRVSLDQGSASRVEAPHRAAFVVLSVVRGQLTGALWSSGPGGPAYHPLTVLQTTVDVPRLQPAFP